jgi:hypothetical protein
VNEEERQRIEHGDPASFGEAAVSLLLAMGVVGLAAWIIFGVIL